MSRQKYTTEQIINKLRQVEVLLSQGRSVREVAKELSSSDHTYYRWRLECGWIRTEQAKRLKKLKKENDRLREHRVSTLPISFLFNNLDGRYWI